MTQTTLLHSYHIENRAKIVDFAGFHLPLYYLDMGIQKEHKHCRTHASLFDVSHMLQTFITPDATSWDDFSRLFPVDLVALPLGSLKYCFLANEQGGVIDDLIIGKVEEQKFLMVSNASRASEVLAHCQKFAPNLKLSPCSDSPMIALQGPDAAQVMREVNENVAKLSFMQGAFLDFCGVSCWVSRTGYTGEDGFELIIPAHSLDPVLDSLLNHHVVQLAGLGARDSLRLEAGLCLYGHELTEQISPIDAGLTWTISKSKREVGAFIGSEEIIPQIGLAKKKRVGLIIEGKRTARQGFAVLTQDGERVGEITSGGYAISLENSPIAMGFVDKAYSSPGQQVKIKAANQLLDATVTQLPFIKK